MSNITNFSFKVKNNGGISVGTFTFDGFSFTMPNVKINPATNKRVLDLTTEIVDYDDVQFTLDGQPYDAGYLLQQIENKCEYNEVYNYEDTSKVFEVYINAYLRDDKNFIFSKNWKIFDKLKNLRKKYKDFIVELPYIYANHIGFLGLDYVIGDHHLYSDGVTAQSVDNNNELLLIASVDTYTGFMYAMDDLVAYFKNQKKRLYMSKSFLRFIKDNGSKEGILEQYGD